MTHDVRSDPGGLVPGEQLAGYQIQEPIGRGGMAVVYRALDLRLGRMVALKVLAPHLGEDEAFRQRFIRESRAAAGVDHPHIIPVFEAGEAGGVLFIAMRYVGHGDVRLLIEDQGRLSPGRTAAIASQVASALDAAHAHGLVHRDVKPGNMLLGQASGGDSDHVYLSDFGLSKHSLSPSTLTSTGQFLGTLDYVSPEQIQGQPVDGRADQYALACTVVEMLTGAPPFRRDDSMALMWAQLESAPPSLTERRPDLRPEVDNVIAIAMAKSPASRFPTCRDFALALSAACDPGVPPRAASAVSAPRDPAEAAPPPYPQQQARREQHQLPDQQSWRDQWPGRSGSTDPDAAQAGFPPDWRGVPATSWDRRVPEQNEAPLRSAHDVEQAKSGEVPPTKRDDIRPGTRSAGPGHAPLARGRGRDRRKRHGLLAALLILVGLAGLGGIGYKLLHHPAGAGVPAASASTGPTGAQLGPAATVEAYFAAINSHHFQTAWKISGKSEAFGTFEAGYSGTEHDTVTILSTVGNVVTARLVAHQTDGTIKRFEGTYTVTGGVITAANVRQLS